MTPPPTTPPRPTQVRLALALRRRLARRQAYDRLDEAGRQVWRDERLAELRRHAASRSRLYRRTLTGTERAPLGELPTIDKTDVVDRFDELVTVDGLHHADLRAVLHRDPNDPDDPDDPDGPGGSNGAARGRTRRGPVDRYRLATSSGSSGSPAVLAFDEHEWIDLIANAARGRALAGPTPAGTVRSAKVGSPSRWHLSTQLPATLRDPRKPSLTLSAAEPIAATAAALDAWAPTILSSYPSVLRRLLAEQRAGTLDVAPAQVFSSGEHLSEPTRQLVREVWAVEVFDQYVATEVGFLAVECAAHDGLHVLDDHVEVEIVDDDGRPCRPGEEGQVLVTSLHARTLPLIRYRLGDRATWAAGACGCGRGGPRLRSIAGADRDPLVLRSADTAPGTVPSRMSGADRVEVHPVTITALVDRLPVGSWQVLHGFEVVRLQVTRPAAGFDGAVTQAELARTLHEAGVHHDVDVVVEVVPMIEAAAGGKAARFRAIAADR